MAMLHFFYKHHTVKLGSNAGGLAARYLQRIGEYAPDAARYVQYHARSAGKWKDLADWREGKPFHLPPWAEGSAEKFFEAAAHPDHTYRNARWSTSIQMTLPRELSRDEQIAVTETWIATHFPNRPGLWALHEPLSKSDGLPQPHVHLLVSPCLGKEGDPERSPEQMFQHYNPRHPEKGGAPKARQEDRQTVARLRESWAASVNVYLEKTGAVERMDPRSFQVRGITRQPLRREAQGQVTEDGLADFEQEPVDERTPETRAQEAALAAAWWTEYKRVMGLEAAQLRDPHAALTLIAREVREPGSRAKELGIPFASIAAVDDAWYQQASGMEAPHCQEPHEGLDAHWREHDWQRESIQKQEVTQPYIGNVRSKIVHAPGDPNYGDVRREYQAVFATLAEAEEAGFRPAQNQHYSAAAQAQRVERLAAEETQVAQDLARLETALDIIHDVRQGKDVPIGTLMRVLAGRDVAEVTGRGLTMKLYEREQDYGR